MSRWSEVEWFVVFHGLADAYLWEFDTDGWRLLVGDPAMGSAGVAPMPGGAPARIADAWWLADAFAFDHDAPVGLWPAWDGERVRDPNAEPVAIPIVPIPHLQTRWYWEAQSTAYGAVAEARFQASYVLRYDDADERSPSCALAERFKGREEMVALYAMAARQLDVLSEYLCLYRILEAADRGNGKTFAARHLPRISDHDFGTLSVASDSAKPEEWPNAFDVMRDRAAGRIEELGLGRVTDHLYGIRNSLRTASVPRSPGRSGQRSPMLWLRSRS